MPKAVTTSTTPVPFIDPVIPLAQNLAMIWRSEPTTAEMTPAQSLANAISELQPTTTDGAMAQLALVAEALDDLREVLHSAANVDGLGTPSVIAFRASRLVSSAIATLTKMIPVDEVVGRLCDIYAVTPQVAAARTL
jgi:hypothetical protein